MPILEPINVSFRKLAVAIKGDRWVPYLPGSSSFSSLEDVSFGNLLESGYMGLYTTIGTDEEVFGQFHATATGSILGDSTTFRNQCISNALVETAPHFYNDTDLSPPGRFNMKFNTYGMGYRWRTHIARPEWFKWMELLDISYFSIDTGSSGFATNHPSAADLYNSHSVSIRIDGDGGVIPGGADQGVLICSYVCDYGTDHTFPQTDNTSNGCTITHEWGGGVGGD